MTKNFYSVIVSQFVSAFMFILFVFIFSGRSVAAVEITNGGFESGAASWNPTVSTVSFSIIDAPVYEASHAAHISYASSTSSGIKQTITAIQPDQTYKITAVLRVAEGTKKAFLRLAWYQQGNTSQIKTDDSINIDSTPEWSMAEIIATAPAAAASAEIRVLVSEGSLLVDDVRIQEYTLPSPTPTLTPSATQTPTPIYKDIQISVTASPSVTPTITSSQFVLPQKIYLSEVMAFPESAGNEWVELYNDNDQEVRLTNWYLDDISQGGSAAKSISITIPAKGYGVVDFSSSLYNNDGDTVRLLDPQMSLRDSFEYGSVSQSYSMSRISFLSDTFCESMPTKGASHTSCFVPVVPTATIPAPVISTGYTFSAHTTTIKQQSQQGVVGGTTTAGVHKFKSLPDSPRPMTAQTDDKVLQVQETTEPTPAEQKIPLGFAYSLLSLASVSWKMYVSVKADMI